MAINCEDIIRKGLKRSMSEAEIMEMLAEAKTLARRAQGGVNAANLDPRKLSQAWQDRQQMELIARKRATHLQAAARLKMNNLIKDNFQGIEVEGMKALLCGSAKVREGARFSADAQRNALTSHYVGSMVNELERLGPGHFEIFSKGTMDREIYQALFTIDNKNATPVNVPKEAMEIAQVIHKWQEIARMDENGAGAWIGKLPGYVLRQSHDQLKLSKAGYEKWKEFIEQRLDWERTRDGIYLDVSTDEGRLARDEYLRAVFQGLKTGVFEKTSSYGEMKIGGGGSLAGKVSRERSLHFKDGLSRFEYDQTFGSSTLREGVIRGLMKSAQDTALMRTFGPSPKGNMDLVFRDIEGFLSRTDENGLTKWQNNKEKFDNIMSELDGTVNMAGNPTLAQVGRVVRAIQSMAKLGSAMISGFADVPGFAMEMRYQGQGFWRSMAKGIAGLAKGRGSLAQREILSSCGVFFDSVIGNIVSNFRQGDALGKLAATQNLFFKLNCLSFWTDSWKKSACLMMSHRLALNKSMAFGALDKRLQRALNLYGIDEGRWDLLRSGKTKAADGRDYLTPDTAFQASDAAIEAYMKSKGMLVSENRIYKFREELAEQLRSYFRDRTQYAMLEPDARTGSIIHQGTRTGTGKGELARLVMQFKSFPIVVLQRSLGRELFGYGADTMGKAIKQAFVKSNGERTGLPMFIMASAIAGYISMTTKQLLKGKTPRDFTESPEAFAKVFFASLLQGGAFGLYGDFLFAEKSRLGGSFAESLLGPTASLAGDIYRYYQGAIRGEDVYSRAAFTVFNQLPGNNIFWLRPALDELIMNSLYEWANPGYVERSMKRAERETNQSYFKKPNVWNWAQDAAAARKENMRIEQARLRRERKMQEAQK